MATIPAGARIGDFENSWALDRAPRRVNLCRALSGLYPEFNTFWVWLTATRLLVAVAPFMLLALEPHGTPGCMAVCRWACSASWACSSETGKTTERIPAATDYSAATFHRLATAPCAIPESAPGTCPIVAARFPRG